MQRLGLGKKVLGGSASYYSTVQLLAYEMLGKLDPRAFDDRIIKVQESRVVIRSDRWICELVVDENLLC
jgi:hypothetical protein